MIFFTIVGIPVAKGRPKFFKRGAFMGTYTPEKTRDYADSVISQALPYKPFRPIDSPIRVELKFYFPVPQSAPKKLKLMADSEEVPVAKKPDLDNLVKAILDPLNTVFWVDDKLIVALQAVKLFSDNPRTEVSIEVYAE